MPTFKHPCPHCGTFIGRDVVACPACGRADPFAPGRCPACSAIVEAGWVACPRCGASLIEPSGQTEAAPATPGSSPEPAAPPPTLDQPATPSARAWSATAAPAAPSPGSPAATAGLACAACGSQLPAGARFCRECGTPVD